LRAEEFKENNIHKKKNLLNIFLDRINLCDLPFDILNGIITRETTLLEKHILRFVCKKIHDIVHHFSYPLSITSFDSERLDELAAKDGNLNIFKWVVSNFDKKIFTQCML
jgi:hypothetical protein